MTDEEQKERGERSEGGVGDVRGPIRAEVQSPSRPQEKSLVGEQERQQTR